MRAALDLLFGEQGEPTLYLIDPGCGGWRKVNMEAWVACKPSPDRSGFVSAVVIHDQMHLQPGRRITLNGGQEFQELLGTMAPMQLTNYFATGYIERSKQSGSTVAQIIVRASLWQTW